MRMDMRIFLKPSEPGMGILFPPISMMASNLVNPTSMTAAAFSMLVTFWYIPTSMRILIF